MRTLKVKVSVGAEGLGRHLIVGRGLDHDVVEMTVDEVRNVRYGIGRCSVYWPPKTNNVERATAVVAGDAQLVTHDENFVAEMNAAIGWLSRRGLTPVEAEAFATDAARFTCGQPPVDPVAIIPLLERCLAAATVFDFSGVSQLPYTPTQIRKAARAAVLLERQRRKDEAARRRDQR